MSTRMNLSIVVLLLGLVALAGLVIWRWPRSAVLPAVGSMAPDFTLRDQHGVAFHLADARGQWLVLYFYPKDDTPGCTQEACHFRDDIAAIQGLGARIVGVSLDDAASHQAFSAKYRLPFTLLSDPGGRVAAAYGSLWSLGPVSFARRHSFIVDPQGRIAQAYRSVDTAGHAQQIVAELKRLQDAVHRAPVR